MYKRVDCPKRIAGLDISKITEEAYISLKKTGGSTRF